MKRKNIIVLVATIFVCSMVSLACAALYNENYRSFDNSSEDTYQTNKKVNNSVDLSNYKISEDTLGTSEDDSKNDSSETINGTVSKTVLTEEDVDFKNKCYSTGILA